MRIAGTDAALATFKIGSDTQGVVKDTMTASQKSNTRDTKPQQKNSADKSEVPITEKEVSDAVEKVNKMFEGTNRRFEISVHEKTGGIIIKIVDSITNEIIREVPPKKILDMIANMMEMAGLIVDERR